MCPRVDRMPATVVALGPFLGRMEPARRRPDPMIASARWSKGLAASTGKSGSFTRRQVRGEEPTARDDFDAWLDRLMQSGHVSIARARVAEDCRIVRATLVPLPEVEHDGSSLDELAAVQETATALAAQVLRNLADDGVRDRGEMLEELERIREAREALNIAEAAVLAELDFIDGEGL